MLNEETDIENKEHTGAFDKRTKKRCAYILGLLLSSAIAVTSMAYKGDAAYVPCKEIGPGIGASGLDAGTKQPGKQHEARDEAGPGVQQQPSQSETKPEAASQTQSEIGPGQQAEQPSQQAGPGQQEQQSPEYIVKSGGREIDLRKPMIALTFDDGPDSVVGNEIMDALEAYDGRATFFLVGDRVASRQTVVKRMAKGGHELANHSMNHRNLRKLGEADIKAQVNACNDIIEKTTGVRPKLMRLPGGNSNELVMSNINMPVIQWNIDTRDWATKNAMKTVNAVVGKVKDGDIVLMHELYKQTAEAVRLMLPQLKEQGFQFVTVSELIEYKGKTAEPNKLYYHFHP